MKNVNFCLIASVASLLSFSDGLAQGVCPAGLTHVGQAYKDDSQTNREAKVRAVEVIVALPVKLKIDQNYRQVGGSWAGGSASAVMADGDVPNGFAIIAGGTTGGEKGWSVHKPDIIVLREEDDVIVQRGVKMRLYCHSGSSFHATIGHVSCNVKADICVKAKN